MTPDLKPCQTEKQKRIEATLRWLMNLEWDTRSELKMELARRDDYINDASIAYCEKLLNEIIPTIREAFPHKETNLMPTFCTSLAHFLLSHGKNPDMAEYLMPYILEYEARPAEEKKDD